MAGQDVAGQTIMNVVKMTWPVLILIVVALIAKTIVKSIEKKRLLASGINEIDSMDGKKFEKYLEAMFEKLGYTVERTKYIGDYGADLVTSKDGVKTVIQAKRHKSKIGVKAIQEAVAAKGYYNGDKTMVVTNSYYTDQAIELAKANNVELWDRDTLIKILLSTKESNAPRGMAVITETTGTETAVALEEESAVCDLCGNNVSQKVRQYCIDNSQKFNGKIYCYGCQRIK